ncbi:MAG: YcjF family protein [Rhodobacteraceae bacterium]|nr:YcjF family protein [Paracoccaceae bacterium]
MTQDHPSSKPPSGAVLIELDDEAEAPHTPATAPAVPEVETEATRPAMARLATAAARPGSALARWFWGLAAALIGVMALAALWSAIDSLLVRAPALGLAAGVLAAGFGLVCLVICLREIAAFSRLRRIDHVQSAAATAIADGDLAAARKITEELATFYGSRPELRWGRDRIAARLAESFDPDAALALAETELLAPLDAAAVTEVEAATRQVATVTALVPLAFADVIAALTSNLRMIRRVSEIYGGRSGTLGTWRLTRAVLSHLVATGAVAVGDDLIGSVGGGHLLSKISRRFGEGIVNGALTARVGVAAIEVCRPLPFGAGKRPSVSGLVKRALAGLFSTQN